LLGERCRTTTPTHSPTPSATWCRWSRSRRAASGATGGPATLTTVEAWLITRESGAATLRIEPLGRLPKQDRTELAEEGGRLLAFAAGDARAHRIRFARAG
jgi:hypothetical protein